MNYNCFLCYDSGEIYFALGEEFDFEYCQCKAGLEKYEKHSLYLVGELFTTPEARQRGNEMGSNLANEMADGTLSDLGIMLDMETQMRIHLTSNHYPPVPTSMIQPCIEAIDAVNDLGLWDLEIPLPEGVFYKYQNTAPAHAIIENHHLEAWIIEREEY